MAFIPAIVGALGGAAGAAGGGGAGLLTGLGALVSAGGTIMSGVAAKNAADYEARQMEIKAAEERAAAGREAEEKRKEARLVMSRQQALAAASGAGAGMDAPTIVKLMTQTAGQGEYGAQTVRYGGESRMTGLLDSAKGRRMSGRATLLGSVFAGAGQAIRGFG
jgi:hypothetical protein